MIDYGLSIKGSDGSELWSTKLEMRRNWIPEKCFDGTLPNIRTLRCKLQQDLHPWDPGYTPPPPEGN